MLGYPFLLPRPPRASLPRRTEPAAGGGPEGAIGNPLQSEQQIMTSQEQV